MNNIIVTHNALRLDTGVNHIHNYIPNLPQQSGESQIVIAERVIVLVLVLAENSFGFWVSLKCQGAWTAGLLRWDLPFPSMLVLVILLPAHEFA